MKLRKRSTGSAQVVDPVWDRYRREVEMISGQTWRAMEDVFQDAVKLAFDKEFGEGAAR